jgi:hypothetical protein
MCKIESSSSSSLSLSLSALRTTLVFTVKCAALNAAPNDPIINISLFLTRQRWCDDDGRKKCGINYSSATDSFQLALGACLMAAIIIIPKKKLKEYNFWNWYSPYYYFFFPSPFYLNNCSVVAVLPLGWFGVLYYSVYTFSNQLDLI